MNPHFKSSDDAEEVAFYLLFDVIANIKAMNVLFAQYELLDNLCEHELEILSKLGHAVKEFEYEHATTQPHRQYGSRS